MNAYFSDFLRILAKKKKLRDGCWKDYGIRYIKIMLIDANLDNIENLNNIKNARKIIKNLFY